jgi:hypothetical protein
VCATLRSSSSTLASSSPFYVAVWAPVLAVVVLVVVLTIIFVRRRHAAIVPNQPDQVLKLDTTENLFQRSVANPMYDNLH